jgi:hypothetical protein
MCLSTFLALVIGLYLFFMSLAMLVHQQRFKKIIAEFLGNQPLLTLSGGLGMIFGLLIVISHNVWVASWPLLITLVGWITLIQGLARIFFPEHFVKVVKEMQARVGYALMTWVWLLVGVYLVWAGLSQ